MAKAGPIPMTSGGTPTTALALRTPRTGRPRASTAALRPSSTAAAPSLTWLELPAHRCECELLLHVGRFCSSGHSLTCCGAAVGFEGRSEFGESLQRRSSSDALVFPHRHLPLAALAAHKLSGDGNDLLLEPTLRPGCPACTITSQVKVCPAGFC